MRSLGLIGLVLALLIVGVLVKKQMSSSLAVVPVVALAPDAPVPNVRVQSEQIQQQVREQLDAASKARPMPDDVK